MVETADEIRNKIKRLVISLVQNGIPIEQAVLFGSYARGDSDESSDIDVALVSPIFKGIRFIDSARLSPFALKIDSRLETHPYTPIDYATGKLWSFIVLFGCTP